MAKQRRMGWAGHVARMGAERNACRIFSDTLKIREQVEEMGVAFRITLN